MWEALTMSLVQEFQSAGDQCVFRASGVAGAGELAHAISAALDRAREERVAQGLVDLTAMSGFESPGPAFRRWAVGLWAKAAGGGLRVAILARREHICPAKTGLLAAAEEGLHANI